MAILERFPPLDVNGKQAFKIECLPRDSTVLYADPGIEVEQVGSEIHVRHACVNRQLTQEELGNDNAALSGGGPPDNTDIWNGPGI